MEMNIILAGVGGQGILSIAYVLDKTALEMNLQLKQAEVHGMAQRGGAVQSHLRISERPIHSDLIPRGRCDMILSVEPLEALRQLPFLKPDGMVVASTTPVENIPDYPDLDKTLTRLDALDRQVLVDSRALARAAGTIKASNIVMVGAAAEDLPMDTTIMETVIAEMFERKGKSIVEKNLKAFRYGMEAGKVFRRMREAGSSGAQVRTSVAKLDPKDLLRSNGDSPSS